MNPRPRPTRPDRTERSLRRGFPLIAALAALLAGCAAPLPPPPTAEPAEQGPVLARDADFAVVVARTGDDLATLAERYLGDRRRAWWIAEFNGIENIAAGQEVVIPLRPRNAVGVHPNGFQTIPILCYHRFGTARSKLTVTPATFEAQMEYLARNGYRVLPLADLPAFLQGREPLPQKTVIITIDDGYRSNYDIAFPILRKYGFPATVFLYSDFVGASDAMTWAQMREMVGSGLIEVQPHSKTHANLTLRLPGETDAKYRERIRREIEAPTSLIKDRLGLAAVSFAYPYGDVNEMVIELLTQQGTKLGATVTPGGNGFFAPPHMLRRTMIFGNEDLDVFKSKLATYAKAPAR
jgi:peptidoglycan/xylan/chitin deacetylase (PgdA/CDA1 family)